MLDARERGVEAGFVEIRRHGDVVQRVRGLERDVVAVGAGAAVFELGDEFRGAAFVEGMPEHGPQRVVADGGEGVGGFVPGGDVAAGSARGRLVGGDDGGGGLEEGVEVAGDGGGDVDGVFGRFVPDEGEVDVDGVAVHAEANGVRGHVEEVEDAPPFELELDGFVEEDEVLAVEGFGGAEVVEGVVFEAVAGEAVFHGLHGDAAAAGALGLG